jgi:hypothetical protein
MKVISLYQPWAAWVVTGQKTIETRGHDRFRGLVGERIAIHATKHFDEDAVAVAAPWWPIRVLKLQALQRGAIIGFADVVDARWLHAADSAAALCPCHEGRFGLILANAKVLDVPVKIVGHQGIWTWNPEA